MINLPDTWPMWCEDVQQLKQLAGITEFAMMDSNEHNALADARETHARYHQCLAELKRKGIQLDPLPQTKKFQRNQQAR